MGGASISWSWWDHCSNKDKVEGRADVGCLCTLV